MLSESSGIFFQGFREISALFLWSKGAENLPSGGLGSGGWGVLAHFLRSYSIRLHKNYILICLYHLILYVLANDFSIVFGQVFLG